MVDEIKLKDRKKEILLSSVESYIENSLPITSQKVYSSANLNLSPATLRNELNALEEMGYLKQLHTSGGRIPTTKAYRYFVNYLMENNFIDIAKVDDIRDKFKSRSAFLQDILKDLAQNISQITNYPTVVSISGYENLKVKEINVIPLITKQALVLIKTDAGIISNTINLQHNVSEENCKDASKYLTTSFYDKKIDDIIKNIDIYSQSFNNQITYYNELLTLIVDVLKSYAGKQNIYKSSPTSLILDETRSIDSTKKLISVLENDDDIKKVMENIDDNNSSDVVFAIGEENGSDELNDFSIVKANYQLSSDLVTNIGVIGPKSLDYAKIASALKYIIDEQKKGG